MRKLILSSLLLLVAAISQAQLMPERKFIREGNKEYEKGNYPQSEVSYMRAREKTPNSYEANFNLLNAMYKQERYDEAAQGFDAMSKIEGAVPPEARSQAFYNAGNALFKQRKLEDALEAYKNALRLNPGDQQAKFNYAYTKKLLEKNQDKDKKQDKEENKEDQGNKDQQNPKNQSKDQPKPKDEMSRQQAEQLLNAVQNTEDKTREKVEAKKVPTGQRSSKNW